MSDPLAGIKKADPSLYEAIESNRSLAFKAGALDTKYKILTALALDASKGSEGGVRSLARQAIQNGATKEEILETLRVAYFITGGASIYVAAYGLNEILDEE